MMVPDAGTASDILAEPGEAPGLKGRNEKGMVVAVGEETARRDEARDRVVRIGTDRAVDRGGARDERADLRVRPGPRLGLQRQGRIGFFRDELDRGRQVGALDGVREFVVGQHEKGDPWAELEAPVRRLGRRRRARRRVAPGEVLLVEVDIGKGAGLEGLRAVPRMDAHDCFGPDAADVARAEQLDRLADRWARRWIAGDRRRLQREVDRSEARRSTVPLLAAERVGVRNLRGKALTEPWDESVLRNGCGHGLPHLAR